MRISSKDKAITTYLNTLATYHLQGVSHEMAVRQAFAALLEAIARQVNWTLIMEETLPNRKRIDGVLRDEFKLKRGYWEAKDSHDDLEAEILKKKSLGYPLTNTIFEDSRTGILFQNNQRVLHADLSKPSEIATLLTQFFTYTEPLVEEFHVAVQTFQERIPDLADALTRVIDEEEHNNDAFVTAFEQFYAICQQSLNPNISPHAIREMLVQHLLTERLFRTIFNNPDFPQRNVIAVEIEKVIQALTSRSFSRSDFLKSLDSFYLTIERAAATITNFSEKQTFLNTVYERFFQGFSKKQADTHGIVYTPQEIVDFMCASVDAVLKQEFSLSLSSEGVTILDPCVGTGNFIVNILRRINPLDLAHKYQHELFCNEVMLLPYYIASLNIEHAYYELMGRYEAFEGISFVDTLDLARLSQQTMFAPRNAARVKRQKATEITVIIGNPPYNVGQMNENDNNKNRQYEEVDQRIRETYVKDSRATRKTQLYDMYVRFFRWAVDRLGNRDGVICFVSNNGFLDGIAFDGFRKHMVQDFTHIYHLDLGGNSRRGFGESVFNIRVGVGITILVRKAGSKVHTLHYHCVPEDWRKKQKLLFLAESRDIHGFEWEAIKPDTKQNWLTRGLRTEFDDFLPMGTKEAKSKQTGDENTIFSLYSLGVNTGRDEWVYDFSQSNLTKKMQLFVENYNYEVFRYSRQKPLPERIDDFVNSNRNFLKWTDRLKEALIKEQMLEVDQQNIRRSLYRPFCQQFLYFDHLLNQRHYQQYHIFPTPESETENVVIIVSDIGHRAPFSALVSKVIPDLHTLAVVDAFQCFPFYTYDEDGTNRRENITDSALSRFLARYDTAVSKWDIFYYTYAILHHPTYRARYAENLRRELPRIPMVGDSKQFFSLVELGTSLVNLHLHYEQANEYSLTWVHDQTMPITWRVDQMKLSPDKSALIVNDMLMLEGIPPSCYDYQLGNRSALEWVIDQYRVRTDKRSGITNDPNRKDDPKYIARLVGQVITVSVETVALVEKIGAVELGAE